MIILSSGGTWQERALSSVVLPLPVPPETAMLLRARTAQMSKRRTLRSTEPLSTMSCKVMTREVNVLIVSIGPSSASGGTMAFTRCPCARRAFTIGDDSSIRLPSWPMIRSMSILTSSSLAKRNSLRCKTPSRS